MTDTSAIFFFNEKGFFMSFAQKLETILSSGPKDKERYITASQLLSLSFIQNLQNYCSQHNPELFENIKKTTLSVVRTNFNSENSVSNVNYRRVPAYIELYNKENKKCVRIILSTTGENEMVCGYYSDVTKNVKNNHFCSQSQMQNEFITNIKLMQSDEFLSQTVIFLLGGQNTPFVNNDKQKLN